jgi:peptidoglycan/xylan/chitin deacetylase (PgdA/CDA1 family)
MLVALINSLFYGTNKDAVMKIAIWIYHFFIAFVYRLRKFAKNDVSSKSDFRILLFHDIDTFEKDRFISQIESCLANGDFIDPNQLDRLVLQYQNIVSNKIMLTFDDGFSSNFTIAQQILNPRNIKAIFFVIPEFVSSISDEMQENFVTERLYPGDMRHRVPTHLRSMTWEEISILSSQGHTIGSHSKTHKRLTTIFDERELREEVITSGLMIESNIKKKVEHFAFPFGNSASISKQALQLATDNYKYVHSGLRGSNLGVSGRFVLRRETVHPWDPKGFELAVLNGACDSRFSNSLSILDGWSQSFSNKIEKRC